MTTPRKPGDRKDQRGSGLSDRSATVIIYMVATVWALSMGAAIVTSLLPDVPDFKPPEYVHGAFLTIVGGGMVLRARGKDE